MVTKAQQSILDKAQPIRERLIAALDDEGIYYDPAAGHWQVHGKSDTANRSYGGIVAIDELLAALGID